MASFRNRGPRQWEAKIRKRGHPSLSKTFSTKAEAEDWAKVTEAEMVRGIYFARNLSEKTLMKNLFADYLEEVTPTMKNLDEPRIIRVLTHEFGAFTLASLQPKTINDFKKRLLKDGKAESTINHYLSKLSAIIRHAETEWHIPIAFNPVTKVKYLKPDNERERRLEPNEESVLLNELLSCKNTWARPAMIFAIETAMRLGEIFSLKAIDVKRHPHNTLPGSVGVAYLPETKNGDARYVPLSRIAIKVIDSLPSSIGGRVFGGSTSEVAEYRASRACTVAVKNAIKRIRARYVKECEASGEQPGPFMDDLTFHDFRHEATSRLAELVPNVIELSLITGHKDLNMLKRYYNIRPESLAQKLG